MLLNNMLAALTIARPKSQLDINPYLTHHQPVNFEKHRCSQVMIETWVRKARAAINSSRCPGNEGSLGLG
jgi:hypothetical protein